MIEINGLGRDFITGDHQLTVLDDINLSVQSGEFVAITGPSGSGKSTLLGLLAGLDRPTRGSLKIDDVELNDLDEDAISRVRGEKIGFVFQSFQLIQTLTALENVRVPAEIKGDSDAASRAMEILTEVGLADRANHYPGQLSGGEMQRTAIARASVANPSIILADEPTGNLDSDNGQAVMELLLRMNRVSTLVLVTHDSQLARLADREVRLKDGRIYEIIQHKRKGLKPKRAASKKSITKENARSSAKQAGKKSRTKSYTAKKTLKKAAQNKKKSKARR